MGQVADPCRDSTPATRRTYIRRMAIKTNGKRRLPKVGDEIILRATVTRVGRNSFGTGDAVTVQLRGHSIPVTIDAAMLHDLEGK